MYAFKPALYPSGIEDNIQMLGFYSEEKPYIDLVCWAQFKVWSRAPSTTGAENQI